MRPRAIVFDVYGTLLELLPAPTAIEAEEGWVLWHAKWLGARPSWSWEKHRASVREEVTRYRTGLQKRGIPHPEVIWNEILETVLPDFRRIPNSERDEATVGLAALTHRVQLHGAAGPFLQRLVAEGIPIGIASNAQPYTEIELSRELDRIGMDRPPWQPELCFWSWRHGFAKPEPHAFRLLDVRLRRCGIRAGEVLMVGDRLDNDIEPARMAGWNGWHLARNPVGGLGGDWDELIRAWDSTSL